MYYNGEEKANVAEFSTIAELKHLLQEHLNDGTT